MPNQVLFFISFKKIGIFLLCLVFIFLVTLSGEAVARHKFTILHTNDSHSALSPHSSILDYHPEKNDPTVGGFARLAGLIAREREKRETNKETVFVISAGDFHGGDPYAWLSLSGKAPELKLLQEIGYDLVTIGNHEYDYGPEQLAYYFKEAGYPEAEERLPILATNTKIPENHPLDNCGIRDYVIRETDSGLKIGFFGLIGDDAVSLAYKTGSVEFTSPLETAKKMVALLQEKGADVVIAITHSGLKADKQLAEMVDGIDVIIGGHSHHALNEKMKVNGTIIVQSGYRLETMGLLELSYLQSEDRLQVLNERSGQPYLVKIDDNIKEDKEIVKQVADYTADLDQYLTKLTDGKFNSFMEPAFYLQFPVPCKPEMVETQFGNFLTDALRLGVEEITGKKVDFAFEANGLIRRGLVAGKTPWGKDKASFYQLAAAAGLGSGPDKRPGYPLVEVYLTESEVKNILEISVLLSHLWGNNYFLQNSGIRYKYDPRRAVLFNIPIIDKPIPTGRAILSAERYTGSGIQSGVPEDYQPLSGNEGHLYRVVTDYYLMQFLPRVGEVVPSLKLVLKNADGTPLTGRDEAIIRHDGEELKVWQALFHYAEMQDGQLSPAYIEKGDRIISVKRFSILARPGLIIVVLLLLIVYLIFKYIKIRKQSRSNQ